MHTRAEGHNEHPRDLLRLNTQFSLSLHAAAAAVHLDGLRGQGGPRDVEL